MRPGPARFLVLFGVFACAACGMVYELALVALGSYLLGNTVVQASVVLSVMVFAMGVGALVSKPLNRWPALSFVLVEAALSLVGGLSVLALYVAFAWFHVYHAGLVGTAFAVGLLIGAEIPLLMNLLQQIREQDAPDAVADMFAADYVGGLLGGLLFPFLLLPTLGLVDGVLAAGAVNAVIGVGITVWLFRSTLTRRVRTVVSAVLLAVVAVLGTVALVADRVEVTARQQLYTAPIVHQERSEYQEVVLTRSVDGRDHRLFLNGSLQFSSLDEYRYHESLVHPAMNGSHRRVLVLGGGDGLAVREVLRHPGVESVLLVDLDPAVLELARTDPVVSALNEHALDDPRVQTVAADAFGWVREAAQGDGPPFDVVLADLPDPDSEATAKLYTVEMYTMLRGLLAPEGRLAVQSGSPYFVPDAYWSVAATLEEAGYSARSYAVDVPSFGNWGFHLAAAGERAPDLEVTPGVPRRFLSPEVLIAGTVFPPDRDRTDARPSTLLDPAVVAYQRRGWKGY